MLLLETKVLAWEAHAVVMLLLLVVLDSMMLGIIMILFLLMRSLYKVLLGLPQSNI